jgi:putative transposase
MAPLSYRRHRFPAEINQRAIWLYLRFTLSYRDVEERLAERGLDVSYETVRRWPERAGTSTRRSSGSPGNRCTGCRRPRGRGSRHAHSASARHAGGTPANAQAAEERGLRTEVAGHRQAGLLRLGFPAPAPHLPSRSRPQKEQSRRKLPSNRAVTRAQDPAVEVVSIRPAVSQHPFRVHNTFNHQRHLISRSTLRIVRVEAAVRWQDAVAAA